MKHHPDSDARAFWAIAWRMVVYLPWMLTVFLLVLSFMSGLVLLPFFVAICFYLGQWGQGAAGFTAWVVLVWGYRHFRLARFLR